MSVRSLSWLPVLLIPSAAAVVLLAGFATPGYDGASRTVSRLATEGMPYAPAVDAAMVAVAASCAALAIALDGQARVTRTALAVAALAFTVAALVHLDDAAGLATWVHRGASGVAVVSLALAPLALGARHGRLSALAGRLEVGLLAVAAVLVLTPFAMWGVWERVALAVPLAWMVLLAWKIASTDVTASAASVAPSSSAL